MLIHNQCGFNEVILDNLTTESNNTKKVTVGLAEEEDAAILVQKINGLFVEGQQLYVETIKKKTTPAGMDMGANQQQQPMLQQPFYQQSKFQPNYQLGFAELQQSRAQSAEHPLQSYGGMYEMSQNTSTNYPQNTSANYGYPEQMQYKSTPQQLMAQSMVGYDPGAPLGFSNQEKNPSVWSDQNDWNLAGNASGRNQDSHQNRSSSKWASTDDSSSRRRDSSANFGRDRQSRFVQEPRLHDTGRNAARRDFGRDAPSRDRGRDAPRDQGRDRDYGRDRNQGRECDQGRDRVQGRERDQGRDRDQGRVRGGVAAARDRSPEPPVRSAPFREPPVRSAPFREPPVRSAPFREPPVRSAPFREPPVRSAPFREQTRDTLYNRRAELSHAPTKRQLTPPPTIYGDHVTNASPLTSPFSHQRDAAKPWNKPQPKQKNTESNYVPPFKRPKNTATIAMSLAKPTPNAPANNNQTPPKSKKKKQLAVTPERKLARAVTWRHQCASIICKEIIKNPKHKTDIPPEQFIPELKRAIRCRLETLFGNDLDIRLPEMAKIYREKFTKAGDTDFFNEVRENIKTSEQLLPDAGEKAVPVVKTAAPPPKKIIEPPKPPKPQSDDTTKKIPSYPLGDKKASKGQKKANAQIFQDEEILLSKMDANMQKALVNEIDELCAVVIKEFEGDCDPYYKSLDERVRTTVVDDYKKMMKVNLAKRMLNMGPVMLRIFSVPKTVSRSKLAPALAEYGVTSLRKSEKRKPAMYYGSCETYDDHDRLCCMDPIVVDGSTVLIKPFHLTGKADKKPKNKQVQIWVANDYTEDPVMEELEQLDEEIDEDIINVNTDYDNFSQTQNVGQGGNGNSETIEPKAEVQDTAADDNEDTNGNVEMASEEAQENIVGDNVDNAQLPDIEIGPEITGKTVSKPVEDSNVENGNNELAKGNTDATPNETENAAATDIDFTADVCVKEEYEYKETDFIKIAEDTGVYAENDVSELNTDSEDFKGQNIIDDIDMADLDDDDLEDW